MQVLRGMHLAAHQGHWGLQARLQAIRGLHTFYVMPCSRGWLFSWWGLGTCGQAGCPAPDMLAHRQLAAQLHMRSRLLWSPPARSSGMRCPMMWTVGALLPVQGAISPPRGVPSGSVKEAVKVTAPLQARRGDGTAGRRLTRRWHLVAKSAGQAARHES